MKAGRDGNLGGSIIDGNFQTFGLTGKNRPVAEDWFAVTLDEPVTCPLVLRLDPRSTGVV